MSSRDPALAPPQGGHLADTLWLAQAQQHGAAHWLHNSRARVQALPIGAQAWPVTLSDGSCADDSYVASLRSAWVRYAADEAQRLLPTGQALCARPALAALDWAWARGPLDHAAVLGNALVSTNLYPAWRPAELAQATEAAVAAHPQRLLALRNVCEAVNPGLPGHLQALGWQLVPARSIYLCDPTQAELWRHNHVKRDQRLLDDGRVDVLGPEALSAEDLPGLRTRFRQLFIDKHSALNPDFSPAFFRFCLDSGWLDLYLLRAEGQPVGVLGLYARHGWLTTPLIGYDVQAPATVGLYRRLMALLLRQARERGLKLHYSSGAGQFKQHRGGVVALEYTAVYDRHLRPAQRWRNAVGVRALQRWAPALLRQAG